jgi:hypothetical protein
VVGEGGVVVVDVGRVKEKKEKKKEKKSAKTLLRAAETETEAEGEDRRDALAAAAAAALGEQRDSPEKGGEREGHGEEVKRVPQAEIAVPQQSTTHADGGAALYRQLEAQVRKRKKERKKKG